MDRDRRRARRRRLPFVRSAVLEVDGRSHPHIRFPMTTAPLARSTQRRRVPTRAYCVRSLRIGCRGAPGADNDTRRSFGCSPNARRRPACQEPPHDAPPTRCSEIRVRTRPAASADSPRSGKRPRPRAYCLQAKHGETQSSQVSAEQRAQRALSAGRNRGKGKEGEHFGPWSRVRGP